MIFRSLRISRRLLIAYVLFLLPVTTLFHSVYSANNALVTFARKEIQGTLYVEALQRTIEAVAIASGPAAFAAAADQVTAAELQHDAGMNTATLAANAVGQLRAAGPQTRSAALSALQALVAGVADGSNLTLDPDLDSYYVMDALTVKGPDLLVRLVALADLAHAYAGKTGLSPVEQAAFLVQEGGLVPALDGLEASLNTAFKANPSGSTRAALAGRFGTAREEVKAALAASRAVALEGGRDLAGGAALVASALTSMSDLAQSEASELRRLLEARVAGFRRALAHDVLLALALFAVAVTFLIVAIQRGVVRPIIATATLMERLAAGDTSVGVLGQERADEVGAMARAVEVFRQTAVRVAQTKASELGDAHRVAHTGTWRRDLIGGTLAVSDELHSLLGTDRQSFEPTPENFLALVHPDDRAATEVALARAMAGEEAMEHQWRVWRPDGSLAWLWAETRVETDTSGRVVAVRGVCRDVTERRAAAERIYKLAHHDTLTGLANRTLLQDRMSAAIARARRAPEKGLAVLCLDLDGFKAVNDLNGHVAGDALLCEVAARLGRSVRETDTVARLGGDEFVVIQTDPAQPAAARALADRLVAVLAEPYDLGGGAWASVTASVGVALFPADGDSTEALLHNADTALYRAKWAGKNRSAFFRPEMDRELRERRVLERDLCHASARGEFSLAWQPLSVATDGGHVTGFEVLLRWNHPERGPVPPDCFIPVAEACGAITAIGTWVLREACREAAGWAAPLRVAVNVSPIQAQQGNAFAETVEHALALSGLDPCRLVLEVTEGVLIREADRVLTALRRLKAKGVQVALDDFGTGYSSLATLRAFPFDKIKIDQGFVAGIADAGQDAAIVRAVLGLARGLDLPVVAEGVETDAQLATLRREGCEEVQGWLIGRPAPIESFASITGTRRAASAA